MFLSQPCNAIGLRLQGLYLYPCKKKKKKKEKEKEHARRKLENSRDVWIEGQGGDDSLGALIVSGNAEFVAQSSAFGGGHSFGTHGALKHGITAVTTINFGMGSVGIMTYSWRTSSYWPDRQYWFIEETPMLSWQPEVMVGGNRAGDEEGCSLSFELYCCYRFPIRKKDGPLYWPTTSHESPPQSQRPAEAIFPPVHFRTNVMQRCDSAVCVCAWFVLSLCIHDDPSHASVYSCNNIHVFVSVFSARDRIVCEMAAAPQGSAPGPVKLCVGECRPELRAQSSHLYSFVVTSDTETRSLLSRKRTSSGCDALGRAELGEKANDKLDRFRPLQSCTTYSRFHHR